MNNRNSTNEQFYLAGDYHIEYVDVRVAMDCQDNFEDNLVKILHKISFHNNGIKIISAVTLHGVFPWEKQGSCHVVQFASSITKTALVLHVNSFVGSHEYLILRKVIHSFILETDIIQVFTHDAVKQNTLNAIYQSLRELSKSKLSNISAAKFLNKKNCAKTPEFATTTQKHGKFSEPP